MKRSPQLLFIKFTAAFASISYELILAQALSAFLSNTVLRYCVTIGLYMFCMGAGAVFVERKLARKAALTFWRVEVALTLVGAAVVPVLFIIDGVKWGAPVLLAVAHGLICLIGFLTGFELPLALGLASPKHDGRPGRNAILSVDYLGAFAGTVVFALVFYPRAGLIAAAWTVSLFNALAAYVLARSWQKELGSRRAALMSVALMLLAVVGLLTSALQESYFIAMYLR